MKTVCKRVIPFVLGWLLLSGQALAAVLVPGTIAYTGNWYNDTTGETGSLDIVATLDIFDTAEVMLDLGGTVFGVSDPAPRTLSGAYDKYITGTVSVGLSGDPLFGDISMTFDPVWGAIIGSMTNVPGADVDHVNFGAAVAGPDLSGIFSVFGPGGDTFSSFGHFNATVVPIPPALVLMLSGLGVFAARIRRRA